MTMHIIGGFQQHNK